MADEVDVEQTLVGIITAALYPNGTSQPCAAGVNCKIFRGWPTTQNQEGAKANGYVNVSVAARNGVEHNTVRYPMVLQTLVGPVHTLSATVSSGKHITIGGTVTAPQNVIALIGDAPYALSFVYAVLGSDTLNSIATGLAAKIAVSFPGTISSGPVVTVNSTLPITARIAASGTLIQEVGRQEKSFQVSIWAPPCTTANSDADAWRTAVVRVVDPALRQLIRLIMPDQVYAHIYYERTITMDAAQTEGLYRRDLYYWVEYATTITEVGYEIGISQTAVQGGTSPTGSFPLPSDVPTLIGNS
jgi:hypothetical protein